MLNKLVRRHWLALFVVLAAHAAQAEMISSRFKLQDSQINQIWDIGNSGEVVGDAWDGTQFGFIYRGGEVERLYGPAGSSSATAMGISDAGLVVGTYRTVSASASVQRSFLYQAGSYTTTDFGLTNAAFIFPRAISPDGHYVSGYYQEAGNVTKAFVYDLQTSQMAATIDPGAGKFIIAQGINNHGQLVGNISGPGTGNGAFLYDLASGQRSDFTFSGAVQVTARAINNQGQIAGWLNFGDGTRAWVGNAGGYQLISKLNGDQMVAQGINDQGQVLGYTNTIGLEDRLGYIASPAVMPSGTGAGGAYTFSAAVVADVPIFIDPLVAVGYEYRTGAGDPLFKTVSLPAGLGDDAYLISVEGQQFAVTGNEVFDFTAHGFAQGVAAFTVTGIEPELMLDPSDPQAFVTQVSFVASGMFTGTQTPLTVDYTAPVPEPAAAWLLLLGGGVLLLKRRRAMRP